MQPPPHDKMVRLGIVAGGTLHYFSGYFMGFDVYGRAFGHVITGIEFEEVSEGFGIPHPVWEYKFGLDCWQEFEKHMEPKHAD